ncbi:hypothetical protein C1H46_001040 [Malus baccata]|uniref:Uncharacterized protein n=1 Tax=Malus baccata TaxID=106549 RepID=A0A540NS70_MALBA|nr:hypothetical protein C1H46_001040 [Malus baccata]
MSHLISTWKAASSGSPAPPPPPPTGRSTPSIVGPPVVVLGGTDVAQALESSTSSVVLPPSACRTHQRVRTPNMASTSASKAIRPAKKNTRGPCRQLKIGQVTQVTNDHITIGYDKRHRATPTAELHSALAHDVGHVVRTECPMLWILWREIPAETKTLGGSKFLEIDVFKDVYVRPGDELAEQLHVTMVEISQAILQESAS